MIETDRWLFVPAKHFKDIETPTRAVRVLVIHVMEAPEKGSTAENVAKYFATMPDGRVASAHVCIDSDSVVQTVRDTDVAYAAPGCNNDGIQIELAGFVSQTREQWNDEYSRAVLERAANVTAQYCIKYGIPARRLSNDELRAGARGIVGHDQCSAVYKKSTHTDPGPNFPWSSFIERVAYYARERNRQFADTQDS